MRHLRLWLVAALLVLLSGRAGAAWRPLSEARSFRLENGLKVVVLHDDSDPVVAVQLLVTAGARNEPAGQTGIAHFVEHMLFRGTASFGPADVTGVIERAGGEWHAYTHLDLTTYYEAAPRELLPTLLRLEAERLTRARLVAAEVEPERGAIWQEYRGYQLDPRSDLLDATLATLFQQHPYRNNTMGWESDLAGIEPAEIEAFYRRWYGTRNAVLAIAGDFDPATIEAKVREAFGVLPPGGDDPRVRTVEPALTGQRRITIRRAGAEPSCMISFLAPPPSDTRRFAALVLLDAVLGSAGGLSFLDRQDDQVTGAEAGPASRLGALVASGAAGRIGTSLAPLEQGFHYSIYAAGGLEAEAGIFETLEAAASSISAAEVESARKRVRAQVALETDSLIERAHEMAYWTGLGGQDGLGMRAKILAALDVVPAGELHELLRTFAPARAAVGLVRAPKAGDEADADFKEGPATGYRMRSSAAGGGSPASQAARPGAVRSPVRPPVVRADRAEERRFDLGFEGRALIEARPGLPTFALAVAVSPAIPLDPDGEGLEFNSLGVRCRVEGPGDGLLSRRGTARILAEGPAHALDEAVRRIGAMLARGQDEARRQPDPDPRNDGPAPPGGDPEARARARFVGHLGPPGSPPRPLLASVVSPWTPASVLESLRTLRTARQLTPLHGVRPARRGKSGLVAEDLSEAIPELVQGRLLVAVPGCGDPDAFEALAWLLHHDYGGRLGDQVIGAEGLAYSIDSEVESGRGLQGDPPGWASFAIGADPRRVGEVRTLVARVFGAASPAAGPDDPGGSPGAFTPADLDAWRGYSLGAPAVASADPERAAEFWLGVLFAGEDPRAPRQRARRASGLTIERLRTCARWSLDPGRRFTFMLASPPTAS